MAWTEERVEKLTALWNEGMSASQIAKELGEVTRNAVIGKVHRLGLSSRTQGKAEGADSAPAATPAPPAAEKAAAAKPSEPAPAPAAEKPDSGKPAPERSTESAQPSADVPVIAENAEGALPSENAIDIAEIDRKAKKLSLMELTERCCKWPIGDPSRGEFYFCGQPALHGKPYCAGHAAAAYQPMSSRRDRDRARANRAAIGRRL